jgi:hypothetical protein
LDETPKIRVLVCEGSVLVREGLERIVESASSVPDRRMATAMGNGGVTTGAYGAVSFLLRSQNIAVIA